MAESLKTVLMSALTSKATPAESDTLIVGEGNVLKKISFSQLFTYLKDKLGINTLNTKLTTSSFTVSRSMVTLTTDLHRRILHIQQMVSVFAHLDLRNILCSLSKWYYTSYIIHLVVNLIAVLVGNRCSSTTGELYAINVNR